MKNSVKKSSKRIRLKKGEAYTLDIPAKYKEVCTGIQVRKGERYRHLSKGKWKDWYIECDADGYEMPIPELEHLRALTRYRKAPFFCLVGQIGLRKRSRFKMGNAGKFTCRVGGELRCFANDISALAYRNNSGKVKLTVRREA